MAAAIRVVSGRKSVEPNLAESLHSRNHLLDDMFSARVVKMQNKKKKDDDIEKDADDYEDNDNEYIEKVGVNII